jgi:hypothetical protein
MNNELGNMFYELKRLTQDFWPEELRWVITRFNELRKQLPQRVPGNSLSGLEPSDLCR